MMELLCAFSDRVPSSAAFPTMFSERYARIEHENRILLGKMSEIMQGRKGIDNECEASRYTHSLNRDIRKRELQRITAENQVR
jgi:tRNA isopentenyl-2-thiomethyl-A-37 hydroxylase MiaE